MSVINPTSSPATPRTESSPVSTMEKSNDLPPNPPPHESLELTGFVLGLMAKYWEPGRVKTRLGVEIGMEKSARLHQTFVSHLTTTINVLPSDPSTAEQTLVVAPPEKRSHFAAHAPPRWKVECQCEGNLGQRMQHWFSTRLQSSRCAILIGADCPTLDEDTIRAAVTALDTSDIVLGPCVDGGYYLIGIQGPWRDTHDCLFADVPWSTDEVFNVTRKRAGAVGLSVSTLPTREDVDTIVELERLRESLKQSRGSNANHARLGDAIESILHDSSQESTG